MTELSERKREVLFAVVENYISTAEPVGSSHIAKSSRLELSPATIRHVMAELEEMGFLLRPHTSSGGVPTDFAYRFYVDRLIQFKPLAGNVQDEIRQKMVGGTANLSDLLKDTCKWISIKAHQPVVGTPPNASEQNLKHIQFVRLRNNLALAVLVTTNGIVENKVLQLDRAFSQEELNQMHNYLNSRLVGHSMNRIRQEILLEMKLANQAYGTLLSQALILGEKVVTESPRELHVEGQSLLCIEPEFSNIQTMHQVLRTLEEKTQIISLLDQALQSPGVRIWIGDEIKSPEINGLSLITSTYSDADGNRGVLGVLGPTRLDYAHIVPLVDYTTQLVTEALGDLRNAR